MKKIILLIIEKIRKALKVDEKGNSFGWGKGILLLAALMMVGCDERLQDGTYRPHRGAYKVYVIDSCEYYGILANGNYNFLSHKGNCRFCEERDSIKWENHKKELKELIEQ